MAVEKINRRYKGELTVGSSEISFLKHFPSIGFSVNQVYFFPDKTRAVPFSGLKDSMPA